MKVDLNVAIVMSTYAWIKKEIQGRSHQNLSGQVEIMITSFNL